MAHVAVLSGPLAKEPLVPGLDGLAAGVLLSLEGHREDRIVVEQGAHLAQLALIQGMAVSAQDLAGPFVVVYGRGARYGPCGRSPARLLRPQGRLLDDFRRLPYCLGFLRYSLCRHRCSLLIG